MNITARFLVRCASCLLVLGALPGCLQRQSEVNATSGADERLNPRFGLTDDAQDPTKRDDELGYGRWKAKPDPEGTTAPTSPSRRGSWTGSP